MIKAFILIEVEAGREEDALKELKELKTVEGVYVVYGACDIIVRITAEDMNKLQKIISGQIRKIDAVYSTDTLIIV